MLKYHKNEKCKSDAEGTKRYIRGNGRLIASDSENAVTENHHDLKCRIECHYEYDAFGNVVQSEEKIR